ncbi:MAG: hypothetical protein BK997_01105 [Candidatus Micrarchaeum sp. ARMAN-1]|nr:MAG: hypothetical protein BK997_01105 [Candidatus Micrarchaeum sp. ARMAN-1]
MRKQASIKKNIKLLLIGIVIGVILVFALALFLGRANNINVTAVNMADYQINGNITEPNAALQGFNGDSGAVTPYTFVINAHRLYNITIISFKINTPGFSLANTSPILPLKIIKGGNESLTLYLNMPNTKYTGPLSITEYYKVQIPNEHLINITQINTYYVNTIPNSTYFGGAISGFITNGSSTYLESFDVNNNANYPKNFTSFRTNTTGFNITNVMPSLPVKINSNSSQQFTFSIKTPGANYSGPLNIIGYYTAKPTYVNVTQVNVYDNNASNITELAGVLTGFNTTALGSYYIYSFDEDNSTGSNFTSFTTNTTGFSIMNVTPKLPFIIKSNSSQLFALRIRVPNYTYSGPLSITAHYT